MQTVLIALDFDPGAKKVAEAGYALAMAMQAQTMLLHVVSDDIYYSSLEYSPVTGFSGFSNTDFTMLAGTEGLIKASESFLESIKKHLSNESIIFRVEKGDFAETILKIASESDAGVIVMGSHGRRWLDHILMGSVTEKVLHHTSIPLYIVPVKGTGKP